MQRVKVALNAFYNIPMVFMSTLRLRWCFVPPSTFHFTIRSCFSTHDNVDYLVPHLPTICHEIPEGLLPIRPCV